MVMNFLPYLANVSRITLQSLVNDATNGTIEIVKGCTLLTTPDALVLIVACIHDTKHFSKLKVL